MEANRLNQLLRENPNYLEEFSNDIFNHFTENSELLKTENISGAYNLEQQFLKEIERFNKDPKDSSILQGALIGVYSDLHDAYERRGGESLGLFNQAENINTKDFFDSLKNRIKEQVVYYSDPKHENKMFTSYYIDNIQPQNQTAFSKTLNNIDQAEKTMELAEKTQREREASKREEKEDITIKKSSNGNPLAQQLEIARKAGYVQGVCECVSAIGDDHSLGKKLLSEMNVTKDMAKKFANPETYKALEQGIFAPQQKLEQAQSIKR